MRGAAEVASNSVIDARHGFGQIGSCGDGPPPPPSQEIRPGREGVRQDRSREAASMNVQAQERFLEWERDTRMPVPAPPPLSCDCQFHIYGDINTYPPKKGAPTNRRLLRFRTCRACCADGFHARRHRSRHALRHRPSPADRHAFRPARPDEHSRNGDHQGACQRQRTRSLNQLGVRGRAVSTSASTTRKTRRPKR